MLVGSSEAISKINQRAATSNGIALIYRVVGKIALVCSVITFLVGLVKGEDYTLPCLFYAFVFICISLTSFAIAEVIQILHDIRAKLYEEKKDGSKK